MGVRDPSCFRRIDHGRGRLHRKRMGRVVAGLFLAFPARFPASLTLAERHEHERKAKKGLQGAHRAITAAADHAMGTSVGSLALLSFAVAC